MISKGDIKDLTLILLVVGILVGISAVLEHVTYQYLMP